jgi:hypothetical protein
MAVAGRAPLALDPVIHCLDDSDLPDGVMSDRIGISRQGLALIL